VIVASLRRILHLGFKEVISLRYDLVLALFIIYGFTLDILAAGDLAIEVRNASVAFLDEDHSQLSYRFRDALLPPEFRSPVEIEAGMVDPSLNAGAFIFVIDIPPRFEADLEAGKRPDVQVNVDGTAVAQAYIGASYVQAIIEDAVADHPAVERVDEPTLAVAMAIRTWFNPNRQSSWYFSITELLFIVTMLTMLLPAVALIREQEHGTIEHLLAMPVTSAEILLGKIWANVIVVQIGCLFCLSVVIEGYLGVPLEGSKALFLFGTSVYQFSATAIGLLLATLVRTVPQFVLVQLLVLCPMVFLSGAFTPPESMPPVVAYLTLLTPLRHYVEFVLAVLVRDASLTIVLPRIAYMAAIGLVLFTWAALRFRRHFGSLETSMR
jgi:ABC-2 type transport system permease protein